MVTISTKQSTNSLNFEPDLESLAAGICRRGLAIPAIFFLELYKPLSTVLHAATCVSLPVIGFIFGSNRSEQLLSFLESRDNIEALIKRIEQLEQDKKR